MAMQGFDQNLPPEIDAESQRIARQQAIAEAMLTRSMAPLPTNQGPLHWTQALAQVVNARQGRVDMDAAARDRAGLGQKYQQGLSDEVKRIAALRKGSPEIVQDTSAESTGSFDMSGSAGPANVPGVPANPRSAVEAAMVSQYGPVRQMGMAEYGHMKKSDEPYTLKPGEARYGADGKLLNFEAPKESPEKSFKLGDIRKFLDGGSEVTQEFQKDGTWKEISRGSRREGGSSVTVAAPVTPVTVQDPNDPNRTIVVDGRTGRKIGDGPKLSATGQANAKRQIASQGVGDAITRARSLLKGVDPDSGEGITKSTASGIGTMVDSGLAIFGKSTGGAETADRLKVAGGSLVSKVPRFEGPQSDKDVTHYKEVAGRIGDSTLPLSRRLAALDEVEKIWGEFESGKKYGFFSVGGPGAAPAKPAAATGAPAGVDPAVWGAMTPQERALWK